MEAYELGKQAQMRWGGKAVGTAIGMPLGYLLGRLRGRPWLGLGAGAAAGLTGGHLFRDRPDLGALALVLGLAGRHAVGKSLRETMPSAIMREGAPGFWSS